MRRLCRSRQTAVLIIALSAMSAPGHAENLEQAWAAAIAADRHLSAARTATESARETLSAAKGKRWPTLTLEGGYTVLDNAPATKVNIPQLPILNELPLGQDHSASYGATLSVPLYTGGRISRGIDAAQAGLQAQGADEARALFDLKLQVADAYLNVLRAQRAVEVAERNVRSLEAHAADVQNRYARGLAARNQLLAAQVALADARQRAIQAENARDLAHAAYNRLLGRTLTAPVELEELRANPLTQDVDTLTRRALDQRPELTALSGRVAALRYQSAAERGAAYPQVRFGVGYSYQENRYMVHEGVASANLGVKWDAFDGGVIGSQADATARRAQALLEEQEDVRSRIALEVRQAWLDEQETEKRVPVAQDGVERSEENVRVAQARYREGLATNTEVLDAESQRTLSYTSYYNAVYDAVFADLRLRYATGGL